MIDATRESLEANVEDPETLLLALLPLMIAYLVFATLSEVIYFSFFELSTGGRSPGKIAMGLRVTGDGGLPVDLRGSLVRNILRSVDILPSSYAFGLTAMVFSSRGQRLGDMAAGTIVIRTDSVVAQRSLTSEVEYAPLRLSRDQLALLGPSEIALARGTLRRLDRSEPERGALLVDESVQALCTRLELPRGEFEDGITFLYRLLATVESDGRRSG